MSSCKPTQQAQRLGTEHLHDLGRLCIDGPDPQRNVDRPHGFAQTAFRNPEVSAPHPGTSTRQTSM
ncbi:MAG TPA: hypothetical protein VJV78_46585 [Polyangiales bacterium]|nr:hypothetical protein [Polyangiales bacterium]